MSLFSSMSCLYVFQNNGFVRNKYCEAETAFLKTLNGLLSCLFGIRYSIMGLDVIVLIKVILDDSEFFGIFVSVLMNAMVQNIDRAGWKAGSAKN